MADLQRYLSPAPTVRIEETPVCTVCSVSGDLDANSAQGIRDALRSLAGERRVLVDLCGASFIDSAGLGALIGGIRLLREEGASLAVACGVPAVRRVLAMTGFERLVPVADTRQEAVRALVAGEA
jgi:anti-sigma B factor antagonist